MNQPLIWAHRGASGYMPENTILSFRKAIEQGADGIELDIQLTKDNEIVVCHDETIDRTSNGVGWLKDYTLEELKQFNFNRTHPEVKHAEIPTMREVFELVKDTNLSINIELKTGIFDYEGIEEKIIAMTHEYEMDDRVIYSSFNHYSIKRIQELLPDAKTGFLCEDGPLNMAEYAKKNGVQAVHPWFVNLRYPDFVKECHENGLELNVWTVNDEEYLKKCVELGVHAVITNTPDYARLVIEKMLYTDLYEKYMKEEIHPWLSTCVHARDLYSKDDTRLRLYEARHTESKASIIMVHGFCEFFGKHYENAYRFYQAGYSVYFLELRGHGDSEHNPLYEDQRVGVRSFSDYTNDLNAAVQYVKEQTDEDLYLFAHSMGGLVSALYLEENPKVFRCAVLSSPMLKMNYGPIPNGVVGLMKAYSDVVGNDDDYAPGQAPFDGVWNLEGSSAMDQDRYNHQFSMRLENERYQTYGGTWGWVKASRVASSHALEHAADIRIPVLVLQAGADTMVDNEGQNRFVKDVSFASIIKYPGSKHELFNATDEIREKWYRDVLSYFSCFDRNCV